MAKAITDATNGEDGRVSVDDSKVSVVSSAITPDEFLGILAEEQMEYPLGNGTHAVLRSLSRPDVLKLLKQYKDNQDDLAYGALRMALLVPELTTAQWAAVENGKAGPLMKMGKAVMELAGMIDSEEDLKNVGTSS